ncbi:MAG: flagellar hook-associated protein FlgL [Thermodesulfobacteriota bacterium]
MRVTMKSIHQNILGNLNRLTGDLNRLTNQISSGKQMSKLSDNPVNLITALGLRTNLAELGQYQDNLSFGNKIISASENALTQIKELVMRAKTLALQQANAPLTATNRASAAEEVRHLWEQAVILANTQVNGKYIFGGFRTTGYTEAEPAPFVQNARDGYFINGAGLNRMEEKLTGTVANSADLAMGDLLINGTDIGAVDLDTGALTVNGLNMGGASNLKSAVNAAGSGVTATLTTLYAGAAATAPGAATVSFYLNGEVVNLATGGVSANQTATDVAAAINAISDRTGVTAAVGNTTNGGAANSVVLTNALAGDESAITVLGLSAGESALTGLANTAASGQAADATHNTGTISLSSTAAFEITTSTADDTILDRLGLGGGNKGFADEAADGELIYGSRLGTGDLLINGTEVTTSSDGISSIYADISAAAKAGAINSRSDELGVTAQVTPASLLASGAVEAGSETARLTATMADSIAINAGDLAVNGIPTVTGVAVSGAPTNGLNMQRASDLKEAVNEISSSTGVTASLTTLYGDGAAANHAAGTAAVSFTLNGVAVNVNANGANPVAVSQQVVDAINAVSGQTGVTAARGDGNNGGLSDSIVLYNTLAGDETPIVLAGLNAAETARTGLSDSTTHADATHNTGKVSFSSEAAFELSSPNNLTDDTILKELGLNGGEDETGISGDVVDDGKLSYGSTPVSLAPGDLVINGVDIFASSTAITDKDSSNALVNAINARQEDTGVVAGRDSAGRLRLTALDGRNLHIQTSALGEKVTHLNGGAPAPHSKVYFGAVRLFSDQQFRLESNRTPTSGTETGFAALGLTGGSAATGQEGDVAGDGEIVVNTIYRQNDHVRYAGDRNNDFAIKVGQRSTVTVSKNGMEALYETGVFSVLKEFENFLKGEEFKAATGFVQATDTGATLASGDTGLPLAEEVVSGAFTVTVIQHDTVPPATFSTMEINIDPATDTLDDIAQRLNAVPGLKAYWDDSGYLRLESRDPARYTFTMGDDTSNFLNAAGITTENIQVSSLGNSIRDLETLLDSLTNQISDFGARSNRIMVQTQIYSNLQLANTENLSEQEDTDIIKALTEMQAKDVAYQAALSAAAKTMQLSLVDFLQ